MRQWLLNQVDDFLERLENDIYMAKLNAHSIEAMAARQGLNDTLERLGLYEKKRFKVTNE